MQSYLVNDLYPCVQGEGCLTGQSMILLRLQGCSVGCPWCDTKETWRLHPDQRVDSLIEAQGTNERYTQQPANVISHDLVTTYPVIPWVLITGGEPAEQPLTDLVTKLHAVGKRVALETSGTAVGHLGAGFDWVCVSPKINMPGGKLIQPLALTIANEIKYVVGKQSDLVALDDLLGSVVRFLRPDVQICLQPLSQNEKATQLCLQVVMERGWRLSLQTHKYLHQR